MLIVSLVPTARTMREGIKVKYIDYDWDCSPNGIILDEEFNSDRLGWKGGDLFKLVNCDGRQMLVKVEPIEAFVRGFKPNVQKK